MKYLQFASSKAKHLKKQLHEQTCCGFVTFQAAVSKIVKISFELKQKSVNFEQNVWTRIGRAGPIWGADCHSQRLRILAF